MKKLDYRPDIDGLRAIAVLAVVLFHIDKSILPGGFVGVDVFFVISGYLITGQILDQIKEQRFSLIGFYRRRVNRLMPALAAMLAATLAIGVALLSPMDLIRLAKSATTAAVGFSNVYLWHEYGGYFDAGASEAPLLHTWSLGVEEQFYLIWPLALLAISRMRKVWCISLLAIGLFACIGVSEFGVRYAQSAAYYLLPTRFFEPLAGAVLATIVARSERIALKNRSSAVLGIVGILLVGASIVTIPESAPFPGLYALPATIGTLLIIAAGINQNSVSAQLLGARPLVMIGLMSYSVYLWHWPVIAYLRYVGARSGQIEYEFMLLTSLILGWLSWRFIETPFRRSGVNMPAMPFFFRRYAAPVAMTVFTLVLCTVFHGFPHRWNERVVAFDSAEAARPDQIRAGCHVSTQFYRELPKGRCVIGDSSEKPEGLLIGDSYANHFTGMLDVLAAHDGISLQDYTMDGCAPILGFSTQRKASYAEKCKARNQIQYDLITKNHYKYVVLAADWPDADDSGTVGRAVKASVDRVLASGAHLVIVLRNQSIDAAATCPIRKAMYGTRRLCTADEKPSMQSYMADIKRAHPDITFIDPDKVICTSGICNPVVDSTELYRDDGHLNDVGSRLIGARLLAEGVSLNTKPTAPAPSAHENNTAEGVKNEKTGCTETDLRQRRRQVAGSICTIDPTA